MPPRGLRKLFLRYDGFFTIQELPLSFGNEGRNLFNDCFYIIRIIFQIFFKEKTIEEDGYILFVRKNAIQVLIPKYGLEGTVFLNEAGSKDSGPCTYDQEVSITVLLLL